MTAPSASVSRYLPEDVFLSLYRAPLTRYETRTHSSVARVISVFPDTVLYAFVPDFTQVSFASYWPTSTDRTTPMVPGNVNVASVVVAKANSAAPRRTPDACAPMDVVKVMSTPPRGLVVVALAVAFRLKVCRVVPPRSTGVLPARSRWIFFSARLSRATLREGVLRVTTLVSGLQLYRPWSLMPVLESGSRAAYRLWTALPAMALNFSTSAVEDPP
nr:hypothetical protein [Streptomyces griseus]